MFYNGQMCKVIINRLEDELRAQAALVEACGRRIAATHDPRLKSTWVDVFVRLMNASAATGSAVADIWWAPDCSALPALAALPKLPRLPEMGDAPPPPAVFRKASINLTYGNGMHTF